MRQQTTFLSDHELVYDKTSFPNFTAEIIAVYFIAWQGVLIRCYPLGVYSRLSICGTYVNDIAYETFYHGSWLAAQWMGKDVYWSFDASAIFANWQQDHKQL